jgi:hypothetical protein
MVTIELEQDGRGLYLVPDMDEITEEADRLRSLPTDNALTEVLEYYLCNGWDWLSDENKRDLGIIHGAPFITESLEINDDDEIVNCGRVYWHELYAVEDPIEMLLSGQKVYFWGSES